MYNKATKYLEKGNYTKALQFYKKQLQESEFKELYLNMGNAYRMLGRDDEALDCYIKSNDPKLQYCDGRYSPTYPLALNNLGLLAYAKGSDDIAIDLYRSALTVDPLYYDAIWNYGNALLRKYFSSIVGDAEDWSLGWQMYEYRFKRASGAVKVDTTIPRWDGVSSGDSIVVLTEQGIGDKIMFGRYISCLREKFSNIWVQCHPSLDWFFSDYKICREVDETDASVSIPMCSLAGIYGLVSEKWITKEINAKTFDSFSIGCVWSGSHTHRNNHNRSCSSSYFSGLADLGALYSISPTAARAKNITDISSTAWSETAATVRGLDLVVTVDTSIVHLCGTLGVPCIMIQPLAETDFRWGLGFDDTPWYESVRIIQNDGWDSAFKKVRECIKKFKVDGVL